MLCTSGFVDDATFSHNRHYGASRAFLSGDSLTAETRTIASIPTIFRSTIKSLTIKTSNRLLIVTCAPGSKFAVHDCLVADANSL